MNEPLACDDFDFNVNYNIPTTKVNSRVPLEIKCAEYNGAVKLTLSINPNTSSPLYTQVLENSQYSSILIKYKGSGLILPGS